MSVDIVKIPAAQSGQPASSARKVASADSTDANSHTSFGAALAARRTQGEAASGTKSSTAVKTTTQAAPGTVQQDAGHDDKTADIKPADASDLCQSAAKPRDQAGHSATASKPLPNTGQLKTDPKAKAAAQTRSDEASVDTTGQLQRDPALALDALRARLGGDKTTDDSDAPAPETEHAPAGDTKKHARADTDAAALAMLPLTALTADGKSHLTVTQNGVSRGRAEARNEKGVAATSGKGAANAGEQLAEAARQGVDAKAGASHDDTTLLNAKADRFERAFADAVKPVGGDGRSSTGAGADTSNFLAGLHAATPANHSLSATASTPAQTAANLSAQLNAPVGSEAWNQTLSQHSLRLSHFGDGTAELKLHPQELGQLQISLKMGEHAQLHFVSQHAEVRAAVEAALPQLRQAFANSGINLGQASVSDQGAHNPSQNPQPQVSGSGSLIDQPLDDATLRPVSITSIAGRTLDGGIDIFA